MATTTETQTQQSYAAGAEVDTTDNLTAQKLLKRCQDFLAEVENLYVFVFLQQGCQVWLMLCQNPRQRS